MRNTIIVHGLVSIILFVMSSCMADVSNDTNDRELTSDQAFDDQAPGASSKLRQMSSGDPTGGQLGLEKEAPTIFSCGLIFNFQYNNGWTQYGITNCHPVTMFARVIRLDGSRGPCKAIAPGQTVWDWIFGTVIGIEGC